MQKKRPLAVKSSLSGGIFPWYNFSRGPTKKHNHQRFPAWVILPKYAMGTSCSLWSESGEQNYFPWKRKMFVGKQISHYGPF